MASSISFDPLPDVTGTYHSDMELVLNGGDLNKIKKQLTMRNGKLAWRVAFLKKKMAYWMSIANMRVEDQVTIQNPDMRAQAIDSILKKQEKAREKIDTMNTELAEIEPFVTEELFTETRDGLVVPPGLWYLCSDVVDKVHLNTDLKPTFLPRCRDYQVEALTEMYKYKRAMVEMATGLGKSVIAQSIAMASVNSGKRCMIVVPTEYLVGQMLDEMKVLHPNTTAQGGGRMAEGGWDVLVTTIQSAAGFADLPDVVVYDETHHISAESWTKLAMSLSKATHVYGLTATAFRADGLDNAIHSFVGPIVYSRDVRWGIQNNWLSDFTPFVVTVTPKKNGRAIFLPDTVMATTAYKVLISSLEVMSIARDRLLACVEKGRKVIVVFKTVEACKTFKKFCEDKIELSVASAQMGKKSKAPLRRFQKGDAQVLLVNSGLISEGVDIPTCDAMIQCCQNSSDVMTMQMLGRILRKSEGKKKAVLIDIKVNGYQQFVRAGERRTAVYRKIVGADNIKLIEVA